MNLMCKNLYEEFSSNWIHGLNDTKVGSAGYKDIKLSFVLWSFVKEVILLAEETCAYILWFMLQGACICKCAQFI